MRFEHNNLKLTILRSINYVEGKRKEQDFVIVENSRVIGLVMSNGTTCHCGKCRVAKTTPRVANGRETKDVATGIPRKYFLGHFRGDSEFFRLHSSRR